MRMVAKRVLDATVLPAGNAVLGMVLAAGLAVGPVVGIGLAVTPVCAQDQQVQPLPEADPQAAQRDEIVGVDQLLEALETADKDIMQVSTPVVLVKEFALAGDREARTGTLSYRRLDEGDQTLKQFVVRFDRTITGQRMDERVREYIFDGEWLVEKFVDEKQFMKRQMVAPGQRWDPLRLGEGPFPVPIGQRRADILREYTAQMATDPAEGLEHPRLREQSASTYQLVLEPRPELMDVADYERVRIWYNHDTLLPRMILATNFAGDVTTVVLQEVRTNADAQLAANAFDTTPPPMGSGWDVTIEPWRGDAPAGAVGEGAARIEGNVQVEGQR